jgi:hypothetical protein
VSTTIINYRVRPGAAAEHQRLIEELLAAMARVTARCRLSLDPPM